MFSDLPSLDFNLGLGKAEDARLRRIERKLDILLQHFHLAPEPPAWCAEVETLVEQGKKIAAIRAVRKATGWGLKEAKAYVDELEGGRPLPLMV